jgi:hypothetical protein
MADRQPPDVTAEPTVGPPPKRSHRLDNLNRGPSATVEQGPDGRFRKKKSPEPVLTDDVVPDLEAMQWVWLKKPVTSKQHAAFQSLLADDGPAKFWDRMQRLRPETGCSSSGTSQPSIAWDGTGGCPTCKRQAEIEPEMPEFLRDRWEFLRQCVANRQRIEALLGG